MIAVKMTGNVINLASLVGLISILGLSARNGILLIEYWTYLAVAAASYGVKGLFSFAALDFYGFVVILIITFIVGVLSGILPAKQASKMEPAEAFRYE